MNNKDIIINRIIIFLIIGISLVSARINYVAFAKGFIPSSFQTFFSVLCIFLWALFSMYSGYINNKRNIKFCSLFWGIGLIISVLIYFFNGILNPSVTLSIGIIPVLIIDGSLYGLGYFINSSSDIIRMIINVVVVLLLVLIFFLFGKFLSKRRL